MTQSAAKGRFAVALAFGGAIFFSIPFLMTMEMWWLGFYMDWFRLALFLLVGFLMIAGLSYYVGFKESFDWKGVLLDAAVAFAVAVAASAILLLLFGVLQPGMSPSEVVGKIAVQTVPAGIGAALARSQLSQREEEKDKEERRETYVGELFVAASGAVFVAFNVAPTEEMVLIAWSISHWHALALVIGSLVLMHAFVYAVEFRGQASSRTDGRVWGEFLRLSVVTYVIALLASLYILWTFGRTEGLALDELLMVMVVLGFPATVGAAAARLII